MDLNEINLSQYDLVSPTEIDVMKIENEETFVDITVDKDNTFYVFLPNNKKYLLCRNCDRISYKDVIYWYIFKICSTSY